MDSPGPKLTTGVTLNWPGKPIGHGMSPVTGVRLGLLERWEPPTSPDAPPRASSTLVASDAVPVLDAWRGGDPALPTDPVRLIYLDPPFATGTTFAVGIPVGERQAARPSLRLPAYRDIWPGGLPGYLTFMHGLLSRLRDVLAEDGWLCLHCDHRASAHLRLILDELFGPAAFRNEIVWSYGLGNGTSRRGFPRKHDTLLLYAKSEAAIFTPVRGAVSPAMASKYRHVRADGTRFMRSYGREYDLRGGRPVGSVWDIPSVAPTSGERTGYPTQKPVALLERLIAATTAPGDLVLDPCCGSGTTLVAASGLGRVSVGIDTSPLAVAASRQQLVRAQVPLAVVGPQPAGTAFAGVPTGSHPGGPPRRYTLTASVNRRSGDLDGDDVRTVRLDDLLILPDGDPTVGRSALAVSNGDLVRSDRSNAPLTGHWSDWLSGWAIHLGRRDDPVAPDPFVPVASAFRMGRERVLAMSLDLPVPAPDDTVAVAIRLYDLFGAWSDHLIALTPD